MCFAFIIKTQVNLLRIEEEKELSHEGFLEGVK